MASTSGGSATRGSSSSLIGKFQNEETVEDDQGTEESETESISASNEGLKPKKFSSCRREGLLHEGVWRKGRCFVDCATTLTL